MVAVRTELPESPPPPSAGLRTHAPPRPSRRHLVRLLRRARHLVRKLSWAFRLSVSAIVLVAVLAALAAVPLLNVYVLGYFLAAEGRTARGERWRNVLPWVRYAPRIVAIAIGTAIVCVSVCVAAVTYGPTETGPVAF